MRRYVTWVIRYRALVIGLTLLVTVLLGLQIRRLHIIIDPNALAPSQHPYVVTSNRVQEILGLKWVVLVAVTPTQGDVYQPAVLAKVQRITAAFVATPGVVGGNVLSLSARRAKNIMGTPDGMEVRPLMETVPQGPEALQALRQAIRENPAYLNAIVSKDERTAAVIAEFDPESRRGGFGWIAEAARSIADRERDETVEIEVGGVPIFLAELERYSQRMIILFPLAVVVTGLIHYHAFRTIQGLILPLVTALLAVVWGLGVMGLVRVPLDAFNATTPILILAVAAGHAVQILKRYYEEYHRLRTGTALTPAEANRAAVVEAVTRIGPVMLTAGSVAALSFFSLVVFGVATIRVFGIFTALGILSALVLEMTFIPALRSMLRAPSEHEGRRERERTMWDQITDTIANWVTAPSRARVYLGTAVFLLVLAAGITSVVVDNSTRSFFSDSLQVSRDDRVLNTRLGGTNPIWLFVEGDQDDVIKQPRVLEAMAATQRFLEQQPEVGKTISLADFVKRMHRAMNDDRADHDTIPDSQELISQYLLLYSMSGEPGDFDSYVDYKYRAANVWGLLKTDSSASFESLAARLSPFLAKQFGDGVRVGIGGGAAQRAALTEVMVHGKIMNVLQIGAVILVITSLVFRSLLAGLLVLVPLTVAVLANFGLMGLTGMRLNIATATISAMAVGIGADYAIYLLYRFREEVARGVDGTTAARITLSTAGKAILFVASAIAGGYGLLLFSWGFYIHIWMGILIATAMLVSSLSALTILPSLVLTFRPRFVFGEVRRPLAPAAQTTALLILVAAASVLSGTAQAAPLTAKEIMEKNYVATRPKDSISDGTFILTNKTGQERIRKTITTSKLQENDVDSRRMVRFLSPADVRGTSILTIEHSDGDDDIWVYLPAMKKVRRLVASNKKDSFVGTDFSYGDMIGHKPEEWTHRLVKEDVVDGQPCWVVESLPKTEAVKATSGYAKRIVTIRQDNFVTVKTEISDQAGQPLKVYTASDIRPTDPARGKFQAMRVQMNNLQTGHRTVIQFENVRVNQGLKDELFTTRRMEREE